MEFGIFDHLDNETLPFQQYYQERLKIIERYDQSGFHSYHLAEHHATTLGMAPSPNVFLSAVAQRTTQLRFGPMVYALPLYPPIRLAEEIALIDQMSGGRLDIGFGRGSSPVEISYFGIDPTKTEEIFQRDQPRILEALETGVMHVAEQDEPYRDIVLKIMPLQKPTPRVWYGVHTLEIARRAYPNWHRGFTHLFRVLGRMMRHPRPDTWDELNRQGKGIAGSPATVAAFLSQQLTTSQCNYCVGQFAFGDLSLAELETSVGLFTDKVMPVLRALDTLAEAA